MDIDSGETLFDSLTETNGTWSTSQLPPGNYAIGVVALGYLPPPPTNIVVVANVPQIINTVVIPAATDDNPFLFPQFFEDYSRGIGYYLFQKAGLLSPEQLPDIPTPDGSACSCAYAAFDAYIAAEKKKNVAFTIWYQTYYNGATAVGTDFGEAIPGILRLIADGLAASSGYGEAVDVVEGPAGVNMVNATVNELRDQTTLAQGVATIAAKGTTVLADGVTGITTFWQKNSETIGKMHLSSISSMGDGLIAMFGSLSDLAGTGVNLEEAANLLKSLNGVQSAFKVGSKEEMIIDSSVVTLGLLETYLQYRESKEQIEKAEDNYKEAYQEYLDAVQAAFAANNDCKNCPPPKPRIMPANRRKLPRPTAPMRGT